MAVEMAHAHNLFLRGLNSIYLQAPNVHSPKDAQDLFIFCQAWILSLEHHHGVEEKRLFPGLETVTGKPAMCEKEKVHHEFLHKSLALFQKYVEDTRPEDYRWDDLKAVLDAFAPRLMTHLNDEIPMILTLNDFEDKAVLVKIWKETEDEAKAFKHPRIFVRPLGSIFLFALQIFANNHFNRIWECLWF